MPTGTGSVYVRVQLNGLGLAPLPSSHKGTRRPQARQKGNHQAPTERFWRSHLGLPICPQDMSSSGAIDCGGPSIFCRHLALRRLTKGNNGFFISCLAQTHLISAFLNPQLLTVGLNSDHCQRHSVVLKKENQDRKCFTTHFLFFNATVFGHTLYLLLRNYDSKADSTDSLHILCTTQRKS